MKKNNKGFTFVELMVVIAIASILFAVATVSFRDITKSSRDARRKSDMEAIRQSLELHRSYAGAYPVSIYANCATLDPTATSGICSATQLYMKTTPVDPKDGATQYTYTPTATTYVLTSDLMEKPTSTCPVLDANGHCTYTVYNP